jgi:dolichyl-phosphate-mannose--protein O-mannosyl transferase
MLSNGELLIVGYYGGKKNSDKDQRSERDQQKTERSTAGRYPLFGGEHDQHFCYQYIDVNNNLWSIQFLNSPQYRW